MSKTIVFASPFYAANAWGRRPMPADIELSDANTIVFAFRDPRSASWRQTIFFDVRCLLPPRTSPPWPVHLAASCYLSAATA